MATSSNGPSAVVAAAATAAAAKAVSKKSRSKRKGKRSERLKKRAERADRRAARAESKGKTAKAARLKAKAGVKRAKKELVDTKKGRLDKKMADKKAKKEARKSNRQEKAAAAKKKIASAPKKAVKGVKKKVKTAKKKVAKKVATAATAVANKANEAAAMYGPAQKWGGNKDDFHRRMEDGTMTKIGDVGGGKYGKGGHYKDDEGGPSMADSDRLKGAGSEGTPGFGGGEYSAAPKMKYDNHHMLKGPNSMAPSMSGMAYDKKKMFSTKGKERLHYLENWMHDKKSGSSLSKHFGRNRSKKK